MKKLFFLIALIFVASGFLYSQTDVGSDTKVNIPPDYGITPAEKKAINIPEVLPSIPQELMNKYIEAKRSNDEEAKGRIGREIEKYLNPQRSIPDLSTRPEASKVLPTETDWGIGDIPVYMGNIASAGGWRQLDMKMGEDGCMYIAINRSVSGYNGYISVYRSTDAGRHWIGCQSATNTAAYFSQITLLVEKRHATLDDSTRIFVYFTSSTSLTMDNATLALVSFRRDGSGWFAVTVGTPASGNKFQYPSACSDGMYYDTYTYMHCVVQEVTNAGAHVQLRHYRTTDWGATHASGIINTGWDDFYPSAAFCRDATSDSVYVAVERRFSSTGVGLRLLVLPSIPSSAVTTFYLTTSSNVKYEKPCITIQQEASSVPRKIVVTSTRDSVPTGKLAKYHGSTNGGNSWNINYILGSSDQKSDFTWCNSDSTSASGGYFICTYVNLNGDSIAVRRGIISSMGTVLNKRNAHAASGILPPVVAIYKEGGIKYSAFAYAGLGPTNVYFNQENLPSVGITPIGNKVPDKFELMQNYPNPFNPVTTIKFNIPFSEFVVLKVYDLLGREVSTLVNENLKAGEYSVNFNSVNLTSGVYFYKINTGSCSEVKKMIVTK